MNAGSVTVDELCDAIAMAGTAITRAALRYHCRDPRGALFGIAYLSGRMWMIPRDAAEKFASSYERHGSLRKTGRRTPPVRRPAQP